MMMTFGFIWGYQMRKLILPHAHRHVNLLPAWLKPGYCTGTEMQAAQVMQHLGAKKRYAC